MSAIVIGKNEFVDKVYACWLGKNIGGTLGAPWECHKYAHNLDFYTPVPEKAAANDDLDLQLIWLKMLQDTGLDPSVRTFAEYWSRHAASYPWNEYGFFMRNFSRGLRPPVAGCFENYFVDEMGSPIRSEIWAVLHPADPQTAARMAWKDSCVDHAGGEGMWGEMFWAAVESAAFVEKDPLTLIDIGLSMIPIASHVGRSIREAVWCHQAGKTWGQARERIATRFGHLQSCNAIPNHGFTIIGWQYGKDFGDCLCKAVNCGYDTDCTGATLGSLLGIIGGMGAIPERWRRPVGNEIVLHEFTRGLNAPKTIDELTRQSVELAYKAAAAKSDVAFADKTQLPADLRSRLYRNELALVTRALDVHSAVELVGGSEVALHYNGEPVIRPGVAKVVGVSVGGLDKGADGKTVRMTVPAGWSCQDLGGGRFSIQCDGAIADQNTLNVEVGGLGTAGFTILGPGAAKGFAAGDNVQTCPACHARIEACICGK